MLIFINGNISVKFQWKAPVISRAPFLAVWEFSDIRREAQNHLTIVIKFLLWNMYSQKKILKMLLYLQTTTKIITQKKMLYLKKFQIFVQLKNTCSKTADLNLSRNQKLPFLYLNWVVVSYLRYYSRQKVKRLIE